MIRVMVSLVVAMLGIQGTAVAVLAEPPAAALEAPAEQQTQARVIRRYGAALREDSSPEGLILMTGGCNETFLMLGTNGPWRQLFFVVGRPDEQTIDEDDDIFGWVHADHLAVGPDPAPVDCGGAMGHRIGGQVESFNDRGCLTLRAEASPTAAESDCRPDGSRYEVVSGPVTQSGEEWFELRPLDGGPNGWSRGAAVFPIP